MFLFRYYLLDTNNRLQPSHYCIFKVEIFPLIIFLYCASHLIERHFQKLFGRSLTTLCMVKEHNWEFNGSERPPSAILPSKIRSSPKFIFRGRNFVGCLKIPPL